jgi:hypothetical protein
LDGDDIVPQSITTIGSRSVIKVGRKIEVTGAPEPVIGAKPICFEK